MKIDKSCLLCVAVFSAFGLLLNTSSFAQTRDDYNNFKNAVIEKFATELRGEQNERKKIAVRENGEIFDFAQSLADDYKSFAKDRYNNADYVDAYYFQTKAEKIANYKIISPSNPYSFGILADDMQQFLLARKQLKNVSINNILNSNDGVVLEDSYVAFDCWLEAFEEGNAVERAKRCRDRLVDNLKALRLSLLSQGYNLFEMTTKEDLVLNNRLMTCEMCDLYNKGLYCNSLYFQIDEVDLMDKMNIVIKRLQKKLSYFPSATLQIMYYKNAYGYQQKLMTKRLNAVKNLIYNTLINDTIIKPSVKIVAITLPKEETKQKIFRDAITICVSGNE